MLESGLHVAGANLVTPWSSSIGKIIACFRFQKTQKAARQLLFATWHNRPDHCLSSCRLGTSTIARLSSQAESLIPAAVGYRPVAWWLMSIPHIYPHLGVVTYGIVVFAVTTPMMADWWWSVGDNFKKP